MNSIKMTYYHYIVAMYHHHLKRKIRALIIIPNIIHYKRYISVFRFHSNSITYSGKLENERRIVLKDHFYNEYNIFVKTLSFYYFWIKYKLVNFVRCL